MYKYQTITKRADGLYKDKGSKFIGIALPINSEDEFREALQNIKQEYKDARHHCYAFSIGANGTTYRYSDDGEPNNSAGKPIYGQILSFGITNVLVVVVRYFGGTKLGVGGLIQAYREAAKEALQNAVIIEKEDEQTVDIHFPYDSMNAVMRLVKNFDLEIVKQDFQQDCIIKVRISLSKMEEVKGNVKAIENAELILT